MTVRYPDTHYARTILPPETQERPWPRLRDEIDADVCVVGGGLAGLSAAIGLSWRGFSVALVEARRIAWGASGRNAGFVASGFAVGAETLAARLGRDHARTLYGLSRQGVANVRGRIRDLAIDCAPVDAGYLRVSRRDREAALARRRDFLAREMGEELELWPRERVRQALRSERYHQGLFDPAAFHLHPLNYALGLARAGEAHGIRIFEDSPATGLDDSGVAKTVAAGDGQVRTEHVVLACGGYTDRLVRPLARAIVPVATYIMVTEPLGDRVTESIANDACIADTRRTGNYFRRLPEGRILWGGGMTAWTREPGRLAATMLRDLVSVFPRLAGIGAESAWSGLMGYPRHQMPQIGRLQAGLWYCTGFGGHGMNTTAMAGDLIAAAIAEGDDRYRLFAPFGLDRTWGSAGAAAAQLTYWWYRLRDLL